MTAAARRVQRANASWKTAPTASIPAQTRWIGSAPQPHTNHVSRNASDRRVIEPEVRVRVPLLQKRRHVRAIGRQRLVRGVRPPRQRRPEEDDVEPLPRPRAAVEVGEARRRRAARRTGHDEAQHAQDGKSDSHRVSP